MFEFAELRARKNKDDRTQAFLKLLSESEKKVRNIEQFQEGGDGIFLLWTIHSRKYQKKQLSLYVNTFKPIGEIIIQRIIIVNLKTISRVSVVSFSHLTISR